VLITKNQLDHLLAGRVEFTFFLGIFRLLGKNNFTLNAKQDVFAFVILQKRTKKTVKLITPSSS